jgi:hypothetical protein
MISDRDKFRIHEVRLDRELDNYLTERDLEDLEWRSCPLGPGEACATCPPKIRAKCRE